MTRSLSDVLGAIADRRGRKGRRVSAAGGLAIAISARCLAGANDLRAIFRSGPPPQAGGAGAFGIERAPCPPPMIMLPLPLDGDALARALGGFASPA